MGNDTDTVANSVLLHRLAEKLGLPLKVMVGKGILTDKIVDQMDANCDSCTSPAKCAGFLEARPGKIEAPPSFCVNCRLLTFLSRNVPQ